MGQKGDRNLLDYSKELWEYTKEAEINKKGENAQLLLTDYEDDILEKFLQAKNIILHGAPGTGKTYLARQISKAIGAIKDNGRFEMVQFHPSYDYTDFVEGLRPKSDGKGNIVFERTDGVFKAFCKRAFQSTRSITNKSEIAALYKQAYKRLIQKVQTEKPTFEWGGKTRSVSVDGNTIKYEATQNPRAYNHLETLFKELYGKSEEKIMNMTDNQIDRIIKKDANIVANSIDGTPHKWAIKELLNIAYNSVPHVFLIDEINRGDMSKIFGELFFSIDPGYRGVDGRINTQYQNMLEGSDEFKEGFYIPENVYIIGTMNDIDRSVESMDFAMRRRFQFIEVTAEDRAEGMKLKEKKEGEDGYKETKAYKRMTNLNNCIISKDIGLSTAYQIGGAYFMKKIGSESKPITSDDEFKDLWDYRLEGLLREYLRGEDDIDKKIEKLRDAFFEGCKVKATTNQDATESDAEQETVTTEVSSDQQQNR